MARQSTPSSLERCPGQPDRTHEPGHEFFAANLDPYLDAARANAVCVDVLTVAGKLAADANFSDNARHRFARARDLLESMGDGFDKQWTYLANAESTLDD